MKGPDFEERPWGRFDVVAWFTAPDALGSTQDVVIKKIEIKPGMRLSYQSHAGRDEHWYIVSGSGFVMIEGHERDVKIGDTLDVKKGERHRIGSSSKESLIFIEVSTGSVDENDIVRYEDDFGRTS